MEDGKITETYVYLGLAELIIALGRWPLASSSGYEGLVPGPASHDGIFIESSEPEISRASADLVEGMLKRLATKDAQWKPYWSNNMVWYGPGGLGTTQLLMLLTHFSAHSRKPLQAGVMGKKMELPGLVLTARQETANTHFCMVGK